AFNSTFVQLIRPSRYYFGLRANSSFTQNNSAFAQNIRPSRRIIRPSRLIGLRTEYSAEA
ncbi:hypothetical protein, partial [Peribacillus butanolivorans]